MKLHSKKIFVTVFAAAAILYCFSLTGCKKDDPTKAEKVTKMLTAGGGKWSLSTVTIDGVDVTQDLFSGFSITFTGTTFTTTGTSPVWLREDTWTFKDATATSLIRGQDGKEITIQTITATQLKLSLEWDQTTYEEDGGRKRSLPGKHEFTLTK